MVHESDTIDGSLEHLEAELGRIDVLVQRAVVRWQLAGQDPTEAFRGLHVTSADADALAGLPFGANWGATVSLDGEDEEAFAQAEAESRLLCEHLAAQARGAGKVLRLAQLVSAFGLDHFETDALLICLAPALDLRYERLYAFLQDDVTRKRPSVNLVLDLLCPPGAQGRLPFLLRFMPGAPLLRNGLLEVSAEPGQIHQPLLGQTLGVSESIVSWLLGRYRPAVELGTHAALAWPQALDTDALIAADAQASLDCLDGLPDVLLAFCGVDDERQAAAARLAAVRWGRPLLTLDLAGASGAELPADRALEIGLHDALLTGAIPFVLGWDTCLAADEAHKAVLLATVCAFPGPVILSAHAFWQASGIERRRRLFWIDFPIPSFNQRRALWEHFLALQGEEAAVAVPQPRRRRNKIEPGLRSAAEPAVDSVPDGGVPPEALATIASQFLLTTSQIRDAVATACDRATQRGTPLRAQDAFAAARAHSSPGLAAMARKIAPRYTWTDIVLPDDQLSILREIVVTVRERPLVLEQWGVGKKLTASNGVTILFAGPPGTGKTMAAEVIASELGLDLYKIDLSTIISKYIGETEKNLERIFNEAQSSNAILFFDEADAIFGKRSEVKDAHDRYANIEVSYLLQRMEAYDGVTILATNLRANLDEAFTRRLQFAIDFPFPEEDYRLRIWETLFPPNVPCDADLDLQLLAHRFKLAGGNIRNIIVSAAFLAAADGRSVSMNHLLHGTRRELQKMGRLVNEKDLAKQR